MEIAEDRRKYPIHNFRCVQERLTLAYSNLCSSAIDTLLSADEVALFFLLFCLNYLGCFLSSDPVCLNGDVRDGLSSVIEMGSRALSDLPAVLNAAQLSRQRLIVSASRT